MSALLKSLVQTMYLQEIFYETECKAGLAGRGLAFLKEVCDNTCLPVYAIGGMTPDRLPGVLEAGAKGACHDVGIYEAIIRLLR